MPAHASAHAPRAPAQAERIAKHVRRALGLMPTRASRCAPCALRALLHEMLLVYDHFHFGKHLVAPRKVERHHPDPERARANGCASPVRDTQGKTARHPVIFRKILHCADHGPRVSGFFRTLIIVCYKTLMRVSMGA